MICVIHLLERLASSLWMTLAVMIIAALAAILGAMGLFGMSAAGAVAFYFVVWWLVLFVTLPIAIRSQSELSTPPVAGSEPGAPVSPQMRERAIMTTLLAGIVFIAAIMILPLAGL